MTETDYKRVDLPTLEKQQRAQQDASYEAPASPASDTPSPDAAAPASSRATVVRWSILPLSILICVAQSILTISASNGRNVSLTPTLISVLAFGFLMVLVLLINPALKLIFRDRILKPLNRPELICLFSALLVTSGISTFGLTEQLVPMVAAPWNPNWNTPQSGWEEELLPHLKQDLYITDTETIQTFRRGIKVNANNEQIVRPLESASWSAWMGYYGEVFRAVPWAKWLKPLSLWMIFIAACYGMFYSLTHLVMTNWSKREKLIFPLAKLPESLMPEPGSNSWLPPIFRKTGFWVGFMISFTIVSWNAGVAAEWITQLQRLTLGMPRGQFNQIVAGSIFEGLQNGVAIIFIFTAIGISFLLPLEISFSIWFYFVIGRAIMLLAVWMGYGANTRDFPSDWLWTTNMLTAQGTGGFIVFSAVCMFRCVKDYVLLARGRSWKDRLVVAMPVVGLLLCMTVMVLWLHWTKVNLLIAIIATFALTLTTLGLMRLVAEGGIYWFQNQGSMFHIYKMFGLGKFIPGALIAPLLPIYAVLFLDIKTFMAPNLLTAEKIYEDVPRGRGRFHLNLLLSVAVAVAVSLTFAVFLAHVRGADQMQSWFYTSGPRSTLQSAHAVVSDSPDFHASKVTWFAVGIIWVGLSMYLRRSMFWFPHPIGYVMYINPLVMSLWLSFFVGWVCKKFVVKYGGKPTFDKARVFFIGLIMGELLAMCLYPVLGLLIGFDVPGIDLNRYDP